MNLKTFLVVLGFTSCYGQYSLPVVSRRVGQALDGPSYLPSGNVRQFISYPRVNKVGADALAIAAPLLRGPPAAVLDKVATYGLTNGVTGGIALGARAQVLGPVIAAIITQRTAEVVDVPTPPDVIQPQVLIVEPNLLPVTIEFRSQSSPVNINQVHIPGPPGEVKETRSEEEPDRVLHEVVKPVIQEVREIIQPFRKITQEILPVQEEVHSVVARGENQKVLQEVAIPPPVPVQISNVVPAQAVGAYAAQHVRVAGPARVAVAAPAAIAVAKPVEPVITALGESVSALGSAPSRTVVRAGLIGGARVLEDDPVKPAASFTRRSGRKIPAPREAFEDVSINNRGPGVRPVKRHAQYS